MSSSALERHVGRGSSESWNYLQVAFERFASPEFNFVRLWKIDLVEVESLKRTAAKIKPLYDEAEVKQFDDGDVKGWLNQLKEHLCDAEGIIYEYATELLRQKLKSESHLHHEHQIQKRVIEWFGSEVRDINKRLKIKALEGIVLGLSSSMGSPSSRPPKNSLLDRSDTEKIVEFLLSDEIMVSQILRRFTEKHVLPITAGSRGLSDLLEGPSPLAESSSVLGLYSTDLDSDMSMDLDSDISGFDSDRWDSASDISDFDSGMFRERNDVLSNPEELLRLKMSLSGLRDAEFQKLVALSNYALELETIGEPVRSASSKVEAQIRELEMTKEPHDVLTYHETLHSRPGKEQPSSMEIKINEGSASKVVNTSKVFESFQNLPEHVKRCVFYTSTLFPGDYEFEEDTLIQLWIAAGFIQTELEQLVERGQIYFEALHKLSIFQMSSTVRKNYEPKYRVHKDVYELKQQFFPDEYTIMDEDGPAEISPTTLHSTLLLGGNSADFDSKIFERFYKAKWLKTFKLQIEYGSPIKHVPHILFVKLRFLQVLDLSSTEIKELPTSVCNLKNLRYLDVSSTQIKKLPESVSELYNLQTLKLRDCSNLVGLPKGTSKLINLQHLDLDGLYQLTSMPPRMGQLTNLQKLSIFIVGREEGFCIEELKCMKKLRGSLCIAKMENVTEEQASVAQLGDKVAIHNLEFKWSSSQSKGGTTFNLIQPHSSVKQLKITRYGATSFPKWFSGENFVSLAILHLSYCNCAHLPALGELHSLESLYINQMHSVKKISHEFYGRKDSNGVAFSKLELLEINGMPCLEEWEAIQKCDMPKLRELTIIDCPRLVTLPKFMNLKSLQYLRIILCPQIQFFPGEKLPKSLQSLTITECPKLQDQCQKKDGDEWCKMAGSPEIWIDYKQKPKISQDDNEDASITAMKQWEKLNLDKMLNSNADKKLNDMKLNMAKLKWYKKICSTELPMDYYDCFKRKPFSRDIHVLKYKWYLDKYWEKVVEEAERKTPNQLVVPLGRHLLAGGTNYRRMVEPFDIADYYKRGKRHYRTQGRPRRYQLLQTWLEEEEKAAGHKRKSNSRDRAASLTEDSCFWADVEEAMILTKSLKNGEAVEKPEESPIENLKMFEDKVMGLIDNKAVSPEIFLKESTFMKWWNEYENIRERTHRSSLANFMENKLYQKYI